MRKVAGQALSHCLRKPTFAISLLFRKRTELIALNGDKEGTNKLHLGVCKNCSCDKQRKRALAVVWSLSCAPAVSCAGNRVDCQRYYDKKSGMTREAWFPQCSGSGSAAICWIILDPAIQAHAIFFS